MLVPRPVKHAHSGPGTGCVRMRGSREETETRVVGFLPKWQLAPRAWARRHGEEALSALALK